MSIADFARGRVAGARLDDIGVQRALHEKIDTLAVLAGSARFTWDDRKNEGGINWGWDGTNPNQLPIDPDTNPATPGSGFSAGHNDGHYTGDNKPYVFVTHDFGKHWTSITSGIPNEQWARAIAADIHNRNIVYLNKGAVSQGGFFPAGVNGTLHMSSAFA